MIQVTCFLILLQEDTMKKIVLLLLALAIPALACFSGSMTRATGKPTPSPTATITDSPVIYLPSATATGTESACIVTAEKLNIRKEPNSDVIARIKAGDILAILEDAPRGEWLHIRAGSVTGWINSNYCKGK